MIKILLMLSLLGALYNQECKAKRLLTPSERVKEELLLLLKNLDKKNHDLYGQMTKLHNRITILEDMLPQHVQNVDRIVQQLNTCNGQKTPTAQALTDFDASFLKEITQKNTPALRALLNALMRSPKHAHIDMATSREKFLAYFKLVNPADIHWANNVRRNKTIIQPWLYDNAAQLTREEFLTIITLMQQCHTTYTNALQLDSTKDKAFTVLTQRELWRLFYTVHGTLSDINDLLPHAAENNAVIAWLLVIAKRIASQDGPGIPRETLNQIVAQYTAKIDPVIAATDENMRPLYEQSKTETLQFLQTLKITPPV